MKFHLFPKTALGKWATGLGISFIIMMAAKMTIRFPLPTFSIAAFGLAGFVVGILALIKKDFSPFIFLSILVGVVITLWILGELIYPH